MMMLNVATFLPKYVSDRNHKNDWNGLTVDKGRLDLLDAEDVSLIIAIFFVA